MMMMIVQSTKCSCNFINLSTASGAAAGARVLKTFISSYHFRIWSSSPVIFGYCEAANAHFHCSLNLAMTMNYLLLNLNSINETLLSVLYFNMYDCVYTDLVLSGCVVILNIFH